MHVGVQERLLFLSDCSQYWNKNCPLLGCYAASNGNSLLMFRDRLSVPSSRLIAVLIYFAAQAWSHTKLEFFEKLQSACPILIFTKIYQVCFMRTEGRRDRNDGADGRFSQLLCERAYKLFPSSQRRYCSIATFSQLMLVRQVFFYWGFLNTLFWQNKIVYWAV
jgi:hypothetical protein